MTAATLDKRDKQDEREKQEAPRPFALLRRRPTIPLVVLTVIVWLIVWYFTRDHDTLALGGAETTSVHDWLADRANDLVLAGDSNPLIAATHAIADALNWVVGSLQHLFSVASPPRAVPEIGYVGVIAMVVWLAWYLAGPAMALLAGCSFVVFGLLGFYQDSLDLLIVTGVSVAVCMIIGIPMAIWMSRSKIATAIVTPILDVLQTLPSFAYLLPLMLLFGLGSATAVVCTVVYAVSPVIRIASHGLRSVDEGALEATESMGQTSLQRLRKVELPMAKRTIILGVNQTTMAALAMATIAAFINGPGLGKPVIEGLRAVRVGDAFVPGLCIVIAAIMLDRATTAASEHGERLARNHTEDQVARRHLLLAVGALPVGVAVYLSRHYMWAAQFPDNPDVGGWLATEIQSATDWITAHWDTATTGIRNVVTNDILNPMQHLIAGSPWWLTAAAILVFALCLGGIRAGIAAVICLAGLYYLGLWHDSAITLTSTVVAAVIVMIIATVVGVWMGRSRGADQVIRPLLDALQTLPPFVYLIPALALFGASRFTAIVAGVAYATPIATKVIADGIRGVPAPTVEAAQSAGTSRMQMIRKVQIPIARSSFIVAANQGILYVLSMVVIGGLVGAGALGYDVVAGFSQLSLRGKGLAAGFAIVLLGVMLDRIARYAVTVRRTA